MKNIHVGLIAAVVAGILVALFPLYADRVAPYLWSFNPNVQEEGGAESVIHGIVKSVDPEKLYIVVDGKEISVRGYWIVEIDGAKHENVWAGDLISQYIRPGVKVTVEYKESGRWGIVAQRVEGPGFIAYAEG